MTEQLNDYGELYPGRFLKALCKEMGFGKAKPVFTIANVVADDLEGDKGKERKVIVAFREITTALVLSKINGEALKTMFGRDVKAWIGKRICLYATDQIAAFPTAKGDDRFCIRVFGSPDIDRDLTYEFKMPRKKLPLVITLRGPSKKPAPAPKVDADGVVDTEPFDPAAPAAQEPA